MVFLVIIIILVIIIAGGIKIVPQSKAIVIERLGSNCKFSIIKRSSKRLRTTTSYYKR